MTWTDSQEATYHGQQFQQEARDHGQCWQKANMIKVLAGSENGRLVYILCNCEL